VSTPFVPNQAEDKLDVNPVANKLKDNPVKKGFALLLTVKRWSIKIAKTQKKRAEKKPRNTFPVITDILKHKKAERFITPSIKIAKEPVYSVNKAPRDAIRSGVANIKILIDFSFSFLW
jgi:hypothetical protein